jgi:hypothetical protein
MRSETRQIVAVTSAVLVLAVSLSLLSYARWVRGIAAGNRALAGQDYSAAEHAYTAAEMQTVHSLVPSDLLRVEDRVLVFNRAQLLNSNKRYGELAHLLDAAAAHRPELANDAEYHFWMGIVEYQKAVSETDKQALRTELQQASDSFRMAIQAAPNDWDSKYNYELTSRLLAGMRNKKEDSQEQLKRGGMKILREDPDHPKEQQQKLAPNKQS